jgi:uncharacterized surface protein with fasciclin (FAS1) repeats
MKKLAKLAAVAAVVVAPAIASAQGKNIVETAVGAGQFNTLVTAVQAADLVATLSGTGPFTVFAPNDAAFAKVPQATLAGLLADKNALTAVLTYHVIAGKVMAADAIKLNGQKVKTVNGQELTITVRDGKVYVDGAQVIAADVGASNGVIHVIDSVVLPKSN